MVREEKSSRLFESFQNEKVERQTDFHPWNMPFRLEEQTKCHRCGDEYPIEFEMQLRQTLRLIERV